MKHVKDGQYEGIAESMIPEMISRNESDVDIVSGATVSSKAIKAAVNDALAKGLK